MALFVKTFNELTLDELHDILQLRSEVFVVEQDCIYQDIDGKDRKALHVFLKKSGRIAAYTRCFKPGDYFEEAAIGRVVVPMDLRKFGYGHDVMKASVTAIKNRFTTQKIKLSAQTYLIDFYKSHGFIPVGEEYLEDGIPHIAMIIT
ncbi:GNAT family N-acetyltransferase [Patiriisocius hiemis]|uniref:GNAT family N-acetyltransferase n=1 Tax=Patiriisocius hiemis TaxID=3075604 RepID=A0ABU2YBP7_9FLAO|nr:GNAT family N-acetyltransferase [Constantimarinum sp. W242]MDT0555603.1 GNAT family N-acetyltransferase [Constantimarinum sp. W242]